MSSILQDLRFSFRTLAKKPGLTLAMVLVLALGIGASTAIFGVINAMLLRPLPYEEPERLVELFEVSEELGWERKSVSPLNYLDWKESNTVFEDMAAYAGPGWGNRLSLTLTGEGEPERVMADRVFPNLFPVLGVEPFMGRAFQPGELWAGTDTVAILSHGLWLRLFGGDASVLDKQIVLSGKSYTIVGVMPRGFYYPSREIDLWVPFGWNRDNFFKLRGPRLLRVAARLKDGVTLEQARAEMGAIGERLARQHPRTNENTGVGVMPVLEWRVGDYRQALQFQWLAVAFFLLAACSNIATLLLARWSERQQDLAVRLAMGGSRWQVLRQFLAESLALAVLGGLAALGAGWLLLRLIVRLAPPDLPRVQDIALDGSVALFACAVTALSALLFGTFPALMALRFDVSRTLNQGERSSSAVGGRLRKTLVVAQVALGVVLLVSAGLMLRSVQRLLTVDPGFRPSSVLSASVSTARGQYETVEQLVGFYSQILEGLRGLPGVEQAGAVCLLPLKGTFWTAHITPEGAADGRYEREVRRKEVMPGYFQAMGVPLRRGRLFEGRDGLENKVAILNEELSRRLFPDGDSLGKRIKFATPERDSRWLTVVGVVGSERQDGLRQEPAPEVYEPLAQAPQFAMTLVARTRGEPLSLVEPLRRIVHEVDPRAPVYDVATIREVVNRSIVQERFTLTALSIFALVVLIIAAAGIFGVASHTAARRTREIGIRIALGAKGSEALRLIEKETLTLVLGGVAAGLAVAFWVTRALEGLLYGVQPVDPLTYAAVSLLAAAVALLAAYHPARRAARLNPADALRYF